MDVIPDRSRVTALDVDPSGTGAAAAGHLEALEVDVGAIDRHHVERS